MTNAKKIKFVLVGGPVMALFGLVAIGLAIGPEPVGKGADAIRAERPAKGAADAQAKAERASLDTTAIRAPAPVAPVAAAPAAPPPKPTTKWIRSESQSKLDDSKTVVYGLQAENEIDGWLAHERPTLIARCKEGSIDAFVVTGMAAQPELGEYEQHRVQIRVDEKPATSQLWHQSTDDKALFAPRSAALLGSLVSANRFLFSFTPFNASPQIVEFDVTDFGPAYREIFDTCSHKRK